MKIDIDINVSSEEMYKFLCNSLKNEMNVKEIKEGMEFRKKLTTKTKQSINSSMIVLTLKQNEEYTLKFESVLGINYLTYRIKSIGEQKITLTYIERYETDSFFKKYNNIIVELIMYIPMKRKLKKNIKEIEKYIISQRKEV